MFLVIFILIGTGVLGVMSALCVGFIFNTEEAWGLFVGDLLRMALGVLTFSVIPVGYCICQLWQMVVMAHKAETVISEMAEEYYDSQCRKAWENVKYLFSI